VVKSLKPGNTPTGPVFLSYASQDAEAAQRIPKHATPETAARAGAAPTAFNPPAHSIAVLPFVNMSGDKEQEYFSDGLTEELLHLSTKLRIILVAKIAHHRRVVIVVGDLLRRRQMHCTDS
jgi:hypothetical protein